MHTWPDRVSGRTLGGKMGDDAQVEGQSAYVQALFAGVLLLGFGALCILMLLKRGDASWNHIVYVFAGYEALVFAAAGALFRITVHRATTSAARRQIPQAEQGREDARRQLSGAREQAHADTRWRMPS